MAVVATPMSERKKSSEHCTYTTLKVDDELIFVIRQAAAAAEKNVQEYVSDLLNHEASKAIGKKPITRRTPPERKPRAD